LTSALLRDGGNKADVAEGGRGGLV
jgi:hypothetical protein